jgi:hypothetical protein
VSRPGGPELLARTHYALGSGTSTIDTLPDLYQRWEGWASDLAESHTTYLPLVWFRSPRPLSSWVISLLAVPDSAALYLAPSPQSAPAVPARLCLRSGFVCFREIAQAMGFDIPDEPDPDAGITLSYQEFLDAVARLQKVDFPIERDPADAWPDFVGWRVNYELAAYKVAYALDVVPANVAWPAPPAHAADYTDPPAVRPGQVIRTIPSGWPRQTARRDRCPCTRSAARMAWLPGLRSRRDETTISRRRRRTPGVAL